MDTLELSLTVPSIDQDRVIAWLDDWATGFVQESAELRAYVPAHRWSEAKREWLEERLAKNGYDAALSVRALASKNWNAHWEASLTPVRAGPFVLCPSSADTSVEEEDATVIHVDPAMSFGTGHHATTRLSLRLLADVLTPGDQVLDVGTGTGVLAIAACRSGASSALGVDTDPNAVENAQENIAQNEVGDCVSVVEGSVDVVPETLYDLVTVNITRRVLLDLLPVLTSRLASNGRIILSGVLQGDRTQVVDSLKDQGLSLVEELTEEGWWAACFRRPL